MDISEAATLMARMSQSGLGDAEMAWKGRVAYAMPYEHTILARFFPVENRDTEVRFRASSFEGPNCHMLQGNLIRYEHGAEQVTLPAPVMSFATMEALWNRYYQSSQASIIPWSKDYTIWLDKDLPWFQLLSVENRAVLLQHDIYSGTVRSLKLDVDAQGLNLALRTEDFSILAQRATIIRLGSDVAVLEADGFQAVLSNFRYGNQITAEEAHGRKIEEGNTAIAENGAPDSATGR